MKRDPIGMLYSFNLYEYVRNSPVGFVDPLGLQEASVGPAPDNAVWEGRPTIKLYAEWGGKKKVRTFREGRKSHEVTSQCSNKCPAISGQYYQSDDILTKLIISHGSGHYLQGKTGPNGSFEASFDFEIGVRMLFEIRVALANASNTYNPDDAFLFILEQKFYEPMTESRYWKSLEGGIDNHACLKRFDEVHIDVSGKKHICKLKSPRIEYGAIVGRTCYIVDDSLSKSDLQTDIENCAKRKEPGCFPKPQQPANNPPKPREPSVFHLFP